MLEETSLLEDTTEERKGEVPELDEPAVDATCCDLCDLSSSCLRRIPKNKFVKNFLENALWHLAHTVASLCRTVLALSLDLIFTDVHWKQVLGLSWLC